MMLTHEIHVTPYQYKATQGPALFQIARFKNMKSHDLDFSINIADGTAVK